MVTPEFGSKLKELRRSKSFSQRKLAQFMGVDPSVLCKWESGSKPPPKPESEFYPQLRDILGLETVELEDLRQSAMRTGDDFQKRSTPAAIASVQRVRVPFIVQADMSEFTPEEIDVLKDEIKTEMQLIVGHFLQRKKFRDASGKTATQQ